MASRGPNRRPPLTEKVIRGLGWVTSMARADLESDPDAFEPDELDDVEAALDYLYRLQVWCLKRKRQDQ